MPLACHSHLPLAFARPRTARIARVATLRGYQLCDCCLQLCLTDLLPAPLPNRLADAFVMMAPCPGGCLCALLLALTTGLLWTWGKGDDAQLGTAVGERSDGPALVAPASLGNGRLVLMMR